ncbi:MAG TPA: LysM domain-containing protein [Ilumatobacteraceae bacterium]|nr:LysM domain-containing protein [Ilumatobacteraceae bacterium]
MSTRAMSMTITSDVFEVRLGAVLHPNHRVYVRRRLLVGIAAAILALVGVAAHEVLADRGGAPASTPAVLPASNVAVLGSATAVAALDGAVVGTPYLVQPGETLWDIAKGWHGSQSFERYLDALIDQNGGASVQAGTLLLLP